MIPTYNEADNIVGIVAALLALPLADFHLIIVDDNSPDGTGEIADALVKAHPARLSIIHRPEKQGLGTA